MNNIAKLLSPSASFPSYVGNKPETWPEVLYVKGLPGWWTEARFERDGIHEEEPQYRLQESWMWGCIRYAGAIIHKEAPFWCLESEGQLLAINSGFDGPVGKWSRGIEVVEEPEGGYYETP
jgi:hypothetical protein